MLTAAAAPAFAAGTTTTPQLEEVVITAQKRSENLQDVPISVQALGTRKLDELQVSGLTDYAKFLPSVSIQTAGPGFSQIYMRGVASGENGNHSGPLPSVGVYLDEQPSRRSPDRWRSTSTTSPGRGAGRAAGHALWREFAGWHPADHHQQAFHGGL
jgi:outer membrane receptor protein involved in Fe transport